MSATRQINNIAKVNAAAHRLHRCKTGLLSCGVCVSPQHVCAEAVASNAHTGYAAAAAARNPGVCVSVCM